MSERRKPAGCLVRGMLAALSLMLAALSPSTAEDAPDPARDPDSKRAEYEQVVNEVTLSKERLARLAADIATVRKDRASITAALIQSAKTEQKLGQDIEEIGARLEDLRGQEKRSEERRVGKEGRAGQAPRRE